MSTLIRAVLDDAASAIGDPSYRRIQRPEMLSFYNRAARTVARKLNVLEFEAFFDLATDDLYRLPDDCKQVRKLFVTQTNSVSDSYYELNEIFEDEHAALTSRHTQVGDPRQYYVRQGYFHLFPKPQAAIVNGGKMVYWGLPSDSIDAQNDLMPFPDLVRDTVTEGVIVHCLKRLSRLDEAASREREWMDALTNDRDTMEDRSRDKRPNLRRRNRFVDFYDGQV